MVIDRGAGGRWCAIGSEQFGIWLGWNLEINKDWGQQRQKDNRVEQVDWMVKNSQRYAYVGWENFRHM